MNIVPFYHHWKHLEEKVKLMIMRKIYKYNFKAHIFSAILKLIFFSAIYFCYYLNATQK